MLGSNWRTPPTTDSQKVRGPKAFITGVRSNSRRREKWQGEAKVWFQGLCETVAPSVAARHFSHNLESDFCFTLFCFTLIDAPPKCPTISSLQRSLIKPSDRWKDYLLPRCYPHKIIPSLSFQLKALVNSKWETNSRSAFWVLTEAVSDTFASCDPDKMLMHFELPLISSLWKLCKRATKWNRVFQWFSDRNIEV